MSNNKWRIWLVALTAMLMVGCSSRFAYNNLDWLVHWYMDDYFDLNREQKGNFDTWFAEVHQWHRQTQLVEYQAHLQELRTRVLAGDMDEQDWLAQMQAGRAHWLRIRAFITPELSELSLQLSDEQVRDLFAELDKNNQKRLNKYADKSAEERLEDTIDDIQDGAQDIIGRLTEEQKALIATTAQRLAPIFPEWMNYLQRVQGVAKQLMQGRYHNPHYVDDFQSLLGNPEAYEHPEFIAMLEANRQIYAELMVALQQSLTDKQRQRLDKEVDDLLEDLDKLSND